MLINVDNYKDYQVIDFAIDEAFIDWVLSGKRAIIWENWLENNQFKKSTVNEARRLVNILVDRNQIISENTIEELWSKIDLAIC